MILFCWPAFSYLCGDRHGRSLRSYSLGAPPFCDSNPARPTSTSIEASPNFRRARTAAARLGIRRMYRQSSTFLTSCGVSIIWSRCPRVIGLPPCSVNERPHLGFLCDCDARMQAADLAQIRLSRPWKFFSPRSTAMVRSQLPNFAGYPKCLYRKPITAIALQHAAVVAPALSAYLARPDLRTRRIVPANFASAFSP